MFGTERPFYGISWCAEDSSVIYYAMVAESFKGEADQYDYVKLNLPQGDYKTITVLNWLRKTDSIKDVFHKLMGDDTPDSSNPCIEWYKSDSEMLCMIKSG